MRLLTIIITALALLYSGYWFVGANAVENGTRDALARLQDQGWIIDVEDVSTQGYPSRFDTTVTEILIASPGDGFSYRAPFLQAFALSYAPNKLIAAFANEQKLRIGFQTVDVTSEGLRASASVQANTAASFGSFTAEVGAATAQSDFGWQISLDRALAAMRPVESVANTYDVYTDVDNFVIPAQLHQHLSQSGEVPQAVSKAVFDLRLLLDRPLDRHTAAEFETNPPRPQNLNLRSFLIDWGDMTLSGRGELDVDQLGIPNGRITVDATNWEQMIRLLAAARIIDPGIAPTIANAARTMAQDNDTLSIPISFQNGFVSIGPLPLGPAPRFF